MTEHRDRWPDVTYQDSGGTLLPVDSAAVVVPVDGDLMRRVLGSYGRRLLHRSR